MAVVRFLMRGAVLDGGWTSQDGSVTPWSSCCERCPAFTPSNRVMLVVMMAMGDGGGGGGGDGQRCGDDEVVRMMMAGWGDTERLDMIEPGVGRLVDKLRRSSFLRLPTYHLLSPAYLKHTLHVPRRDCIKTRHASTVSMERSWRWQISCLTANLLFWPQPSCPARCIGLNRPFAGGCKAVRCKSEWPRVYQAEPSTGLASLTQSHTLSHALCRARCHRVHFTPPDVTIASRLCIYHFHDTAPQRPTTRSSLSSPSRAVWGGG